MEARTQVLYEADLGLSFWRVLFLPGYSIHSLSLLDTRSLGYYLSERAVVKDFIRKFNHLNCLQLGLKKLETNRGA